MYKDLNAKQTYDQGVNQGLSAGHVFQKPRETDVFQISTNVAPGETVFFNLTYQEVLKRVHGLYRHVLNVQPDQRVREVIIKVHIHEQGSISFFKVASHEYYTYFP